MRPEERQFSPFKHTPERTMKLKGGGAIEYQTPTTKPKTGTRKRKKHLPNYKEKFRLKRSKSPKRKLHFGYTPVRGSPIPEKRGKSDKDKSLRSFKVDIQQAEEVLDSKRSFRNDVSHASHNSKLEKTNGQIDAILGFYK